MPNLHPIFVHFPIAILALSVVFDLLSILLKKMDLERAGWWALLAGTVFLVAAIVTGLLAKGSIASKTVLPTNHQAFYLAVSIAAVMVMLTGAWLGGEMVYSFRVGIR